MKYVFFFNEQPLYLAIVVCSGRIRPDSQLKVCTTNTFLSKLFFLLMPTKWKTETYSESQKIEGNFSSLLGVPLIKAFVKQ